MQNHIDDCVWQTASKNEGNELKHSQLHHCATELRADTMVLVSSARGKFFGRENVRNWVHRNDEKRQVKCKL